MQKTEEEIVIDVVSKLKARIKDLEARFVYIENFIKNDGAAISYQSMGQYRSAILKLIRP